MFQQVIGNLKPIVIWGGYDLDFLCYIYDFWLHSRCQINYISITIKRQKCIEGIGSMD